MHARDLDVPDSESVYFFLLNSCSARAELYVYFVRVQAISKSCRCTKKVRRAMHEANNGSQKLPRAGSEACLLYVQISVRVKFKSKTKACMARPRRPAGFYVAGRAWPW